MLLRPAYREREIYSKGHGLGMRSQPHDSISVMRVKLQDVFGDRKDVRRERLPRTLSLNNSTDGKSNVPFYGTTR